SSSEIFELHREYGRVVERRAGNVHLRAVHKNDRSTERPLKIGFVSGDLRKHAVAHFLEPYWEKIDKRNYQLFAYQTQNVYDDVSQRLRAHTSRWRNISGMTDEAVVALVKEDQID